MERIMERSNGDMNLRDLDVMPVDEAAPAPPGTVARKRRPTKAAGKKAAAKSVSRGRRPKRAAKKTSAKRAGGRKAGQSAKKRTRKSRGR